MAVQKSDAKKILDKADDMWKNLIRKEEVSEKNWQKRWGWILDEYGDLEKKLKEESQKSKFLTHISTEKGPADTRKLTKFPETTNHEYGWIADHKEFQLDRYGPDIFKAQPLPSRYILPNTK